MWPFKKKRKKSKLKRIWKWLKFFLIVGLISALFGTWYIHHLTRSIENRFERSIKWKVPSRVLSDAEYLYPGFNIKNRDITSKFDRLGYRNMGDKIKGPGDFAFNKSKIYVYLHDFDYPGEQFTGFPISIELSENTITKISNLKTGEELATVRLEPELIAPVFSEEMEDRTLVTLDEVPEYLIEAIVLIEDERFFKHSGIDPIGIARAAVKNLIAMRIVQGGSTLTQQLVKNYFLYHKKSFTRKIKEAILAIILEKRHTKGEILSAYLNEIYLGQRGHSSVMGVGEAAKLYFAKNINQLSLGECALLAGLIKSPNAYSPFNNKEKAIVRRDFVLDRMYYEELIDAGELARAKDEEIVTPNRPTKIVKAPYFIDFVKQQISALYPADVLGSEGLKIFTTIDMTAQLMAEKAMAEGLERLEKLYGSTLPKDHEEPLQAALLTIQPQTGYIRALVGGRDFQYSQFNHITQAHRQPGSTFKPFVYLTAFDPKRSDVLLTPTSFIEDTSFTIESGDEEWTPVNYDEEEHGRITLRQALQKSYNIATAKLGIEVGLDNVVDTARDAGIESNLSAVPSLALGAFEVTPLELAGAYTIFPNDGIRAEPISIINIIDNEGNVLEKRSIQMKRAFRSGPIYLTTNVMKGVLDNGTATASRIWGFKGIAAGKTGTTSDYRDAWFVGFTPSLLTLTWVGYDDNAITNMSGARAALPIWTEFMKSYVGDSTEDFSSPKDIILVKIDPESGQIATKNCPETEFQPFIEGAEPGAPCELHPALGGFKGVFGD